MNNSVIKVGIPIALSGRTDSVEFQEALIRGRGMYLAALTKELQERTAIIITPQGYDVTPENTYWEVDTRLPAGGLTLGAFPPPIFASVFPEAVVEEINDNALKEFAEGFYQVMEGRVPENSDNPSWNFMNLINPNLNAIFITREEVERGDTTRLSGALRDLIRNRATIERFRGQVEIFVDGYNDDERSLPEIPEVRSFYAKLDRDFPYLFWFLDTREGSALNVLFTCVCPVKVLGDGRVNFRSEDSRSFMERHNGAVRELCQRFGIPASDTNSRLKEVESYFNSYYLGPKDPGGFLSNLFKRPNPFADTQHKAQRGH